MQLLPLSTAQDNCANDDKAEFKEETLDKSEKTS